MLLRLRGGLRLFLVAAFGGDLVVLLGLSVLEARLHAGRGAHGPLRLRVILAFGRTRTGQREQLADERVLPVLFFGLLCPCGCGLLRAICEAVRHFILPGGRGTSSCG